MFWGLIMEPGRAYTQTVKVSFHVSMAALDVSNSNDEPSQIMCLFEGRNYLLCTLNKTDRQQCALDLNFEAGTQISFATNGKSHVHLTGYLTSLDDDEFDQEEEEEDEEEATPQLSKAQMKRLKKALAQNGPPSKKFKGSQSDEQTAEEEESSDSDFDLNAVQEEGSDEEEDGTGSEEEQSDDEDEAEEEEDSSSLSEEEVEVAKPKQNGVDKSKKSKKDKANEKVAAKKQKDNEKALPKQQQKQGPAKGKKQVLAGGIIIEDLKDGTGDKVAKAGKFVQVYYEGRLKDNNKMFDSTTKGPGFSFRLGKGEVIKGWDIGVAGMKVGGKRRITCPPKVAYGAKGSPPVIPPNSTLVFDVELKKVN